MKHIKNLLVPKYLLAIAILYSLFITVISLLPIEDFPKVNYTFADKIAHISIHALLFLFWAIFFFIKDSFKLNRKTLVLIIGGCLIYGIIIEILQGVFTDYRDADLFDLIANIIGLSLGLILFLTVKKISNV